MSEEKSQETTEESVVTEEASDKVKTEAGSDDVLGLSSETEEKSADDILGLSEKPEAEPEQEFAYELSLPESGHLLEEDLDDVVSFAKENKIAPELASEILKRENAAIEKAVTRSQAQIDEQAERWKEEARSHKKYGGDNFEQTRKEVGSIIHRYGSKEFKQELSESVMRFHPGLFEFLANIASDMKSDSIASSKAAASFKEPTPAELMGYT